MLLAVDGRFFLLLVCVSLKLNISLIGAYFSLRTCISIHRLVICIYVILIEFNLNFKQAVKK